MTNLYPIELAVLHTITGGADPGRNVEEDKGKGNLGLTYKNVQLGLQGEYERRRERTDSAQCSKEVREAGGTPADILKCYARPTG